jgi:hypothetical protein
MPPNHEIDLEVCNNTEWLRENCCLDLEMIEEGYRNAAADRLGEFLWIKLEGAGYELKHPKGQRHTFHGWNGANTFKHLLGPVGTFCELSKGQQDEIYAIIASARDAAQAEWAMDNQNPVT